MITPPGYKQREVAVMPLAECADGVRGRMAGQYITLIRLVTEYLVSTPLTSRQPFTPTALSHNLLMAPPIPFNQQTLSLIIL